MSFFELISTRHSVRAFLSKSISDDVVQKILSAAVRAPSAGNLQSYKILAVTKKDSKRRLAEAAHSQDFVSNAAVLFVFCAEPARSSSEYGIRGAELYCIQDATIACTFAQLAAHQLGLGTVWVGSFDEQMVSETLGIPQHLRPIAMLVVGYAAERPDVTPRRPMSETSQII